jgi:hypothetical protein
MTNLTNERGSTMNTKTATWERAEAVTTKALRYIRSVERAVGDVHDAAAPLFDIDYSWRTGVGGVRGLDADAARRLINSLKTDGCGIVRRPVATITVTITMPRVEFDA